MRQLPDFTTRNGNKMKIYKIKRIEEADYGCEERPEGYVPKVTVYLEDVAGAQKIIKMEDAGQKDLYHGIFSGGAVCLVGFDGKAGFVRGNQLLRFVVVSGFFGKNPK